MKQQKKGVVAVSQDDKAHRPDEAEVSAVIAEHHLWNTSEVATYLRVTTRTVEYWRTCRVGPRFARIGKHVRYRRSDVEEFEATRFADWDTWQAS